MHFIHRLHLWLFVALFGSLLAACGGSPSKDGEAPTLLSQPGSLSVELGGSATFTVSYSGSAPLTVQWQRDGQPIAGATGPSYTVQPVTAADANAHFTAVVRNSLGVIVSADAVLSVKQPAPAAPVIGTQPQSQTVQLGQTVSFTVQATGAAPLSYQWLRNGVDITGANAAVYTLSNAAAGDSGATFSVRVSNAQGSTTSASATLTVDASAQELASGTVAAQVRLLSAAEEAQIVSSSIDEVRFAGTANLPVGTVVLGAGQAFKVTAVRNTGTQTVLSVIEPRLDELFSTLRIRGNYAAQANHLVSLDATRAKALRTQAGLDPKSASFTWPFSVSDGGLELSGELSAQMSAAIDYDFQQDAGGLRTASLDLAAKAKLDLSAAVEASRVAKFERQVARFRIPIPVTLADRALQVLGVYVVSIQVPVYLGANVEGEFSAQLSETLSTEGTVSLRYDQAQGASANSAFTGDIADLSLNPSTPAGAKVLQTYSANTSLYMRLAPALAFVDRVALLGVDLTLSAEGAAQMQLLSADPAWCATFTPSAQLAAAGFFKAVGLQPRRTDVHRSTLADGRTTYAGNCRAPVTVTASLPGGPSPAVYGSELPVSVTVSLAASGNGGAPSTAPTGRVRVSVEGASCEATLSRVDATSAIARCSLAPRTSGPAVPLELRYDGDAAYAPGVGAAKVAIQPPPYSLYGAMATIVGYYPSLANPATEPLTTRIGPGIEFSSGAMRNLVDGTYLVGATIDVGATYVEEVHTEAADLLPGSFNGSVLTLAAGAPRILACSLSPSSSYAPAQVQVSCSDREVRWSMAGVRTVVGGRVLIDLRLGDSLH